MRVCIVGAGYVGLVTGACLADRGHEVVCVDRDPERVRAIEEGRAPFHEPGLDALLARQRTLRATTDLAEAVRGAELTMIATGTPFDGSRIDLSYVTAAVREVGLALRGDDRYHVVVVKSTVVPGTTDGVVRETLESASGRRVGADLGLGMNPEFLSEGTAVRDFERPDRIVLGGVDERSRDALAELYRGFDGVPVLRTTNATAELVKYASNSLLATLISFSNEIANFAELLPDVDAMEVMRGVHAMRELTVHVDGQTHTASIASFLSPGCGFGGSCLPKDVSALSAWGAERGAPAPVLDAVLRVNRERPTRVVEMLERELGDLTERTIAVLGLAFKPDTDDVRESPAFPLVAQLLERGARVRAYDPVAGASAARVLGPRAHVIVDTLEEAVDAADAVVLVTRWDALRVVPSLLAERDPAPLLIDARRMLEPSAHVRYAGIGLGPRTTSGGAPRRKRIVSARMSVPTPAVGPEPPSSGARPQRTKGGGS